jgi:TolA-binding protein
MSVQVLRLRRITRGLFLLLFAAGSVLALAADSIDQRIYDHAGRLVQEGRSDLALDEYRRLIDSYPRSELVDDALLAIGVRLYAVSSPNMLGRARGEELEEAYRVFDKIRHEHAQGNAAPEAVMRMAYLRLEPYSPKRDVQQARALFGSVSEIYPDSGWVDESRLGMAFCSRLSGRSARVIADLQPFWERLGASSKFPKALLWSAEAYEALGRRERALEIYQRVREEATGTPEATLAEGRLLMLLRRTLVARGVMSLTEDTAFEGLADDLRDVTGVWASPKGWIYVSDGGGGRIVRFDRHGRRLGQRNAMKPALLAFDAYGQAALLEESALKVGKQRWDLAVPRGGKKVSRLRPAAAPLPRHDTNWWFVDERGEAVLEFDSNLNFQRTVWQDVNFQIDRARAGSGGGVWLLDARGARLVHLDTQGEAQAINLRSEPVSLESPVDLAVDVHGAVWVLDADRKGVAVFSPAGDYEGFVQFQGTRQRAALEAVEVDASGALLVYDGKQHRLRRFQDPPPRSSHTRQAEVKK